MLGNAASLRGFLHASAFELVLAAGIFLVLGVGLVARTGSRYVALGLTVATLVGATGALLGTAPVQPRGLFGGLLARDAFGDFFKLLAAAAGPLLCRHVGRGPAGGLGARPRLRPAPRAGGGCGRPPAPRLPVPART